MENRVRGSIMRRKQKNRIQRYVRYRDAIKSIRKAAPDILSSPNFNSTKAHIQHGNVTVNEHVMSVASCSLILSRILHVKCSERELIRGALLHDYFLYDWHNIDDGSHRLHGFFHPGRSLKNADNEYELTDIERDIIRKHMWPLTVIPPACKEAWIVTAADKYCSTLETLNIKKGHGKREITKN